MKIKNREELNCEARGISCFFKQSEKTNPDLCRNRLRSRRLIRDLRKNERYH